MKRTAILVLASVLVLGVGLVCAGPAQAQPSQQPAQPTAGAPVPSGAVLMIYRCDVKPGHEAAQRKAAAATSRAFAKVPGATTFLAMEAVTGPAQVWFVVPYGSLAEVDKEREAMAKIPAAMQAELAQLNDQEGAHYDRMHGVLARFVEEMSLDASFNISAFRAMEVTTYRVRLGRERQFTEAVKKVVGAYKKADIGLRMAVFEVIGGATSGTFLFMRPIRTATQLLPTDEQRKAYLDALGQEALEQMEKGIGEVIASAESNVFTFSPKMSNVPVSYAAADPFWRVTSPAAKAQPKTEGEPAKKATEPVKK